MKQKIIKQVNYWLGVTAIGLVLGLSLQFARAWTEPAVAPPGGNVGAPINTSDNPQSKQAGLALNTAGHFANGLLIPNGNVGIGTANPGTSLDIYSSQPTPLYVRRSSGDNANMKFENTEGSIYMGLSQSEKFAIGTTNNLGTSALMTVQTNGNVGIGTANPGTSLDIYSSQPTPLYVRRSSGDNANMKFENTEGSIYMGLSQSENFAIGTTNNLGTSALMTVQTNGNVGIGTTNPQANLDMGAGGIRLGGVTRTTWPGEAKVYFKQLLINIPQDSQGADYWSEGLGCDGGDVLLGCYFKQRNGNSGCSETDYLLEGGIYGAAWLLVSENLSDHKCHIWRYRNFTCYGTNIRMVAKCMRGSSYE